MVTPGSFVLKLGARGYVENVTYYKIFDVDGFSGGFSPNRWNITLSWLFSCPVLFSSSNGQLEPRGRYSRFMAQMTWFHPKTVMFGVRTISETIWGNVLQKNRPKGAWIGIFEPNYQNIKKSKNWNISKTIHQISPKFGDETHTINGTSWVVHFDVHETQHGWRPPSWKLT